MPRIKPEPAVERRHLTLREVAARLGVSEKTVRRWIARGNLDAWRQGRVVRVSESALRRFLEDA